MKSITLDGQTLIAGQEFHDTSFLSLPTAYAEVTDCQLMDCDLTAVLDGRVKFERCHFVRCAFPPGHPWDEILRLQDIQGTVEHYTWNPDFGQEGGGSQWGRLTTLSTRPRPSENCAATCRHR